MNLLCGFYFQCQSIFVGLAFLGNSIVYDLLWIYSFTYKKFTFGYSQRIWKSLLDSLIFPNQKSLLSKCQLHLMNFTVVPKVYMLPKFSTKWKHKLSSEAEIHNCVFHFQWNTNPGIKFEVTPRRQRLQTPPNKPRNERHRQLLLPCPKHVRPRFHHLHPRSQM